MPDLKKLAPSVEELRRQSEAFFEASGWCWSTTQYGTMENAILFAQKEFANAVRQFASDLQELLNEETQG